LENLFFLRTKLKDQSMKKNQLFVLALAGALFVPTITRAQFAGTVVSYIAGSGVISGYTDPTSALGAPSQVTPGEYGGPVDPFNAPYLSSQIVGIGTGGSLTLHFNTPIQNNPDDPYGLNFIVFGHAGFTITNDYDEDYNPIGTPATDGSFYTGGDNGVTVSVSADGTTFYNLVSPFGTMVDGLFPTDGSGNPLVPVNPALTASNFNGLGLAGIRSLYAGSAGGAGYDLNWAVDGSDNPISLASVDYVRLQNSGDAAYIDAISVVPEPTTCALSITGAGLFLLRRRVK
jgi:hypothetical protein